MQKIVPYTWLLFCDDTSDKQKQLKIVAKLGTSNSTVNKEVCSFRGCLRGRRQKNLEIVAIPHTIQTVEIHMDKLTNKLRKEQFTTEEQDVIKR